MNAQAVEGRGGWPTPSGTARWGDGALSVLLGSGFTVMLFCGIAWYGKVTPEAPAVEFSELAIAAVPVSPPPPAPTPVETAAADLPLVGFELAPSESPVKIAASPPLPDLLRVEDLSRTPPPAGMEIRVPSTLKPRFDTKPDLQHVFQRFEVDKVASVLVETAPQVPRSLFEDENILHTTLVWVVEIDGTASHVRILQSCGKPAVDALLVDMIHDSVFSPAMKGGRKVRMMTSQLITVKWTEGSSFHLN